MPNKVPSTLRAEVVSTWRSTTEEAMARFEPQHILSFVSLMAKQFSQGTPLSFHASTEGTAAIGASHRIVLDTLEEMKHDKWGFVIYRCTYKDDQGWHRFKQIVHGCTQEDMQSSDAPEVFEKLEWTYVEDRAALDGVSRPQLREHFNQWAEQAIVTEQPRAHIDQQAPFSGIPRYNYFIQVDEEALQSVLTTKRARWMEGFVNFVDSRWEPLSKEFYGESDVLDPIDGCTQENVGWFRIAPEMINAEWYEIALGLPHELWYVYCRRSPAIVTY